MVLITDETIGLRSPEYVLCQNATEMLISKEVIDVELDKK
jgi:hypothetical protein